MKNIFYNFFKKFNLFEKELSELKEKINSSTEHNSNERFENIEKSINELKRNPHEVSPFIILILIVLILYLLSKFICYFKYRNHLLYPKELKQPS